MTSRNLEFSTEEDTLKNSLREAVWGPSLLLLALGAVTFGGCRAKTSFSDAELPSTNSVLDSPTTTTALEVTARTTQAKFKAGQDVPLEIRVKNASDVPVKMNFTSGQSFDFQAFKPGDSEAAWTWSADKNFLQAQRSQTLAPGQELKFSETWANVPKGRYNVVASLSANGGLRASAFEIVVE